MSSGAFSPGAIIGRGYRVLRPLAQGGMGAVYVAEELASGRTCAVKVMHARLLDDPKNRARFAQEAEVGEHIGTEHVVDVYARGVDDLTGMPFIAMELLEGETLAARIWRGGRANVIPADETRAALDQLATVLEAAHARALVHRDLKPENIFLTPRPHAGAPFTLKLLDFGVARFVDLSRPSPIATAAIGTPLWMAPEQHTGAEISPAADVWAVGLIAFQLLTGRFYWLAANQKELNISMLLQELLFDALPPASQRAAALGCGQYIPPGFDAWFARCVARDPHARFPSAVEMRVLLRGALANAPTQYAPHASVPSPAVALDAPTVAMSERPGDAVRQGFEQPTVVQSVRPSPPHRRDLAGLRVSGAQQRQRPVWLVPALIATAALLSAGAVLAAAWARGAFDDDGSRRALRPTVRVQGAPSPSMVPSFPTPGVLPTTPLPSGLLPEGLERVWDGGTENDGSGRVARFELQLVRRDNELRGRILWLDDGGGAEDLRGDWSPAKREVALEPLHDGGARHGYRFEIDDLGGLAGTMTDVDTPGAFTTLRATMRRPLVAAPRP